MAKRSTPAAPAALTRKQISRARREARIQRYIVIGTAIVVLTVVALLAYAIVNEMVLKPKRVVATVGEDQITAQELEDRVLFEYFRYTLQPFAFEAFNPYGVIDQMVDELVIAQRAAEMGIEVSDAEVQERMELLSGYDAGEPEPTSTPVPTEPISEASPTATSTFVYTPTPRPTATLAPGITPTITPTSAPTETPGPSPTPAITETPAPTATPLTEEAFNERWNEFLQTGADFTGLSVERIRELWLARVRDSMLRERLAEVLDYTLAETKIQAHIGQIQVVTQEDADAALARIAGGEDFALVAAEVSTDAATSYKGGDLGWIEAGDVDPAVEAAAFDTPIGEVSAPIQTPLGWVIVKVYDRAEVPTTESDRERQRREQFSDYLATWRDEAGVEIDEAFIEFIPELPQLPGQ